MREERVEKRKKRKRRGKKTMNSTKMVFIMRDGRTDVCNVTRHEWRVGQNLCGRTRIWGLEVKARRRKTTVGVRGRSV